MPTITDWDTLKNNVRKHGLYHRNRLAVAPNGSIFYPAPYLSNKTFKYYKSAYDYDQRKINDVYAAAQKHIDQGMSLTLFMRSKLPVGLYEWKVGASPKLTANKALISLGFKPLYSEVTERNTYIDSINNILSKVVHHDEITSQSDISFKVDKEDVMSEEDYNF